MDQVDRFKLVTSKSMTEKYAVAMMLRAPPSPAPKRSWIIEIAGIYKSILKDIIPCAAKSQ